LIEFADGRCCEVDEDMENWLEFIQALPRHLSSCAEWSDWLMAVASPAFATKPTPIYWRGTERVVSH
jgi:hypothetical protein